VTYNGTGAVGQVTLGGVQSAAVAIAGAATEPTVLTPGPGDGNLWFVDKVNGRVGRTDPGIGPVTLATVGGSPSDLVASASDLMWVVESESGELDCITATGTVTSKPSGLSHPAAIALATDDALWYVDTTANEAMRIAQPTTCAAVPGTPIDLPAEFNPTDIAAAPNGGVYVGGANGLVRVSSAGDPTPIDVGDAEPSAIHANAAGELWWVDATNMRIGRYDGAAMTEWALPRGSGTPIDFAFASDDSLWYPRPRSPRSPGSKVTCKVGKTGSGGSGGNPGGGEGLRLRLSRSQRLYATGGRAAKSTRTKVNLHAVWRLEAGSYTLVVSIGDDVTVRVPVRLR
jgi:streptogramin lyase